LDDLDKKHQEKIQNKIDGNEDEDEEDTPTSDLDETKLNTIFGTTSISASDIKLTDWQGLSSFKTVENVTELVKTYNPHSAEKDDAKVAAFKTHLASDDWEELGAKIDGADYWEKFVKQGPKFIIGTIRHYEWQNKLGKFDSDAKKTAVETAIQAANDWTSTDGKKKADATKLWDKDKAGHVAKFLYLQEVGKTGEELVRNVETVETDTPSPSTEDGKPFHRLDNWLMWVAYGAPTLIIVSGAIFWQQIRDWWNGPIEGGEEEVGEKEKDE